MFQYILLLSFLNVGNAQWFFQENSNVLDYSWNHLKNLVQTTDNLFLVQIYDHQNEKCRKFAKKYESIAEGLRGFARVAAVDINQIYEEIPSINLPAFGIFSTNRSEMAMIKGKSTARTLTNAVFEAAEKMAERELSRSLHVANAILLDISNYDQEVLNTLEPWFVAFICNDGGEMSSAWDEVSRIMKTKAKFGYVDSLIFKKYCIEYGVEGESAILYLPRGGKLAEKVVKYAGKIVLEEILDWIEYMINKPHDIMQITNKDVFIKTCQTHESCGILFIPEEVVCRKECRKNYLDMLENFSRKFLKYTFSWLWSEANSQRALEKAFEINHMYPTLIILDMLFMNYTALRGFDTEEEASEFTKNVADQNGEAPPSEVIKFMKLSQIENVDPWKGI